MELRAELQRHRDDERTSAALRSELEESRRAQQKLVEEAAAADRRIEDLRFHLREAEAERERLRTLLAGTVWYEAKVL